MSDLRFNPVEMKACGYGPQAIAEAERAVRASGKALTLIAEIEAVFPAIPRPKITRSVARGYDDEWNLSEERIRELAAQDPEVDWRDVPDEAITACQEYFAFSDAEGFRFYLPAYMRHYLREFPYSGWPGVDSAFSQTEKLRHLTQIERACVDRFIALRKEYETI